MDRKSLKEIKTLLETIDKEDAKKLVKKIEKELTPIKVSSRKAKGRGLQQLVCEKFSEKTGIPWGYDNFMIQPRLMGGAGTDVLLIGEAREQIPFDVECKNTESLSLKPVIEQAKSNTKDGRIWLVVHKRKGLDPVAILDLD